MEKLEVVCLNHFIGRCNKCKPDFNKEHHPNNYDCPGFKPVRVGFYEVKKDLNISYPIVSECK